MCAPLQLSTLSGVPSLSALVSLDISGNKLYSLNVSPVPPPAHGLWHSGF
jgi:hypothetical protein